MSKKDKTFIVTLVLLVLVCVGMLGLLWFAIDMVSGKDTVKPPTTVVNFLDEYLVADEDAEVVVPKYFVCNVEAADVGDLTARHVSALNYIFKTQNSSAVKGYEITKSTTNFVEITMKDEKGESIYPRIGLAYKMTADGLRIGDYTLSRLQPFSRLHKEYDVTWTS